jgi:hypothetical protein
MKRLRFSLRTLLVLVAALGVLMAWVVSQWRLIEARHRAIERIRGDGSIDSGYRYYICAVRDDGGDVPWPLWICGERMTFNGLSVDEYVLEPYSVEDLSKLFPETKIDIRTPRPK